MGGEVKDGIGKAVTCGSGSTWGGERGEERGGGRGRICQACKSLLSLGHSTRQGLLRLLIPRKQLKYRPTALVSQGRLIQKAMRAAQLRRGSIEPR